MANAKIRLFVDHPLSEGQTVPLSQSQSHYLFGVMRLKVGQELLVFDGQNGEYLAQVATRGKRTGSIIILNQTQDLRMPPDLWLVFAPIKKARTDFIVEKSVEMGAAKIIPVQTEFTNSERIRLDRIQAHAVEAAEQCGATFVPKVEELQKLKALLGNWPKDRSLLFCDENMKGKLTRIKSESSGPWAILIGPEGGFSEAERARISELPQSVSISLGPRILRADTAAVAAMTVWQQSYGDWNRRVYEQTEEKFLPN